MEEKEEEKKQRFIENKLLSFNPICLPMLFFDRYCFVKKLFNEEDRGISINVFQIEDKEYVAKIYEKKYLKYKQILKCVSNEYHILKRCEHKNIISLIECFNTTKEFIFVLEYAPKGDLVNFMNEEEYSLGVIENIFKQLICGLKYLHDNKIFHGDMKLDNILVFDDLMLKICDFGFSRLFEIDGIIKMRNSRIGTDLYLAPEIILGESYVGPEVDMWALGVIIYCLVTKSFPFDHSNEVELNKLILCHDFRTNDVYIDADDYFKETIEGLMERDSKKRIKIDDLYDIYFNSKTTTRICSIS